MLVFDVAYFWRIDPARVRALSLSDFFLYLTQAERIAERQREASPTD